MLLDSKKIPLFMGKWESIERYLIKRFPSISLELSIYLSNYYTPLILQQWNNLYKLVHYKTKWVLNTHNKVKNKTVTIYPNQFLTQTFNLLFIKNISTLEDYLLYCCNHQIPFSVNKWSFYIPINIKKKIFKIDIPLYCT